MATQLVWFKRDLRVRDHEPLALAARHGPVLPLYIVEPDLWLQPDSSQRHWAFTRETLETLRDDLAALVEDGDDVMMITRLGQIVRMSAGGISVIGRNTQGVRCINLYEGDQLVAVAAGVGIARAPDGSLYYTQLYLTFPRP